MSNPKLHGWLVGVFVALGWLYTFTTPIFEVSDEVWHYPMVKHLADGRGLPVQDPQNPGPWRQQGSQPPLYYALMAAATFWIDTSDLTAVRWLNPHVDNGIITADRNNNIIIHTAREQAFPGTGTVLAVRLIRLLSVLLAAGTVYFTYRIALELAPHAHDVALGAAALAAFTPMFVFISASVNNDNAVIFFSTLSLWMLMRLVRGQPVLVWRGVDVSPALLGLALGAAALSKTSGLGLMALAAPAVLFADWRAAGFDLRATARTVWANLPRHALIYAVALAVCGWWYARNFLLYGDWLGWNAFVAFVGERPNPASLEQLWGERVGFFWAYWGLFGGVSVALPEWVYGALALFTGAGALGAALAAGQWGRAQAWRTAWRTHAVSVAQAVLLAAWLAALLYGLTRWSGLTQASQGRLIFPTIAVISLTLAWGLSRLRPALWGGGLALAGLAWAVPFTVIAPHYAPPPALTPAQVAGIPHRLEADFGGELRLLGYALHTDQTRPGEAVRLTLFWQAQMAMDRNWSIFTHLVDGDEVLVAQRDRYPGMGALATTLLQPGQTWADDYVIALPSGALAPQTLRVRVGVYDLADGTRLPLINAPGDAVTFGAVALQPAPVRQTFSYVMQLTGYTLSQRVLTPGSTLTVTTTWQALAPPPANYSISMRVLDAWGNRVAAHDAWPQAGNAPTSSWQPGVTITDTHPLALPANLPSGQYALEVVVYEAASLRTLQLVSADGRLLDATSFYLTPVRVP